MSKLEELLFNLEQIQIYHLNEQSNLFQSKKACTFHYRASDILGKLLQEIRDEHSELLSK